MAENGDSLSEVISTYGAGLSTEQIRALPYLAHGMPIKVIAESVGVAPSTVSSWKRNDIEFIGALEQVKKSITDWHVAQLYKVGVYAWDVVHDLLSNEDVAPGDPAYKVKVDAAKFIIGKMNLVPEKKVVDHNLTQPEMNIDEGSADIVARRMMELENGRVVNAKYVDFSPKEVSKSAAVHPDTEYGTMAVSEDGKYQCHVCGEWVRQFVEHIELAHQLTVDDYRYTYGIDYSVSFIGEGRKDLAEEV